MTQTAVEWLVDEFIKYKFISKNGQFSKPLIEQAKEMEKQQIIDAWLSAWKDSMVNPLSDDCYQDLAEEYYNDTFNK
jgi:hypothetical protein